MSLRLLGVLSEPGQKGEGAAPLLHPKGNLREHFNRSPRKANSLPVKTVRSSPVRRDLVDGGDFPRGSGERAEQSGTSGSRPPLLRPPPPAGPPPSRVTHLGRMMELWRKFSNFFWKEMVSTLGWLCPTGLWQGQHCCSAVSSRSSLSLVSKRVSALLVGRRSPGQTSGDGQAVSQRPEGLPGARGAPVLTFVAIVIGKELRVLGQLLPQHQIVAEVAVGLGGRLPPDDQVGGRVGHGDDVPGHRGHCGSETREKMAWEGGPRLTTVHSTTVQLQRH